MLFIPSAREGDGIGHLRRCLELLESFPNGSLCVEGLEGGEGERVRTVASAANIELLRNRMVGSVGKGERWDLVVLDRRSTSLEELARFASCGPIAALDEGGEAREAVPYLIDTLPLLRGRSAANVSSPAFLPQPARRRAPDERGSGRVIITFGGEDPAGLSAKMARALIDEELYRSAQITIVAGPLFRSQAIPEGVELLEAPANLRELLAGYDVVFTSFGLTAYEAVNAGTAVILFNPTSYHRALSRAAGFPEVGRRSVDRAALRRLLANPQELRRSCVPLAAHSQRSIADHISAFDWSRPSACPVCGAEPRRSVARFLDRSFFRCVRCGMTYELDFAATKRVYGRSYFFEEYRAQYGKTYLEDFAAIREVSGVRLGRMQRIAGPLEGKRLLDVGCAFGPFLAEAAGRGARVCGVDVAEEAVGYVQATLGLPCVCSSLEELDLRAAFGDDTVDIITMWYVIEHFPAVGSVLRKVNTLLPMGGMFAFSTPNLAGISGRSDLTRFLAASPRDHFTLWDPGTARRVLRRYGFRVREIRITGHHPERFPVREATTRWRYELLRRFSEVARLGDTFECYAEKVAERS